MNCNLKFNLIHSFLFQISYLESVNSSLIKCNENPCKALKIRSLGNNYKISYCKNSTYDFIVILEKQNFKTKKINFLREKLRAKKKLLRVLSKQANEFLEELIEMKVFLSDNMEIELNIQWDENEASFIRHSFLYDYLSEKYNNRTCYTFGLV